ncbi:hypothetical protein OROMI_031916 [Orobanche minor]
MALRLSGMLMVWNDAADEVLERHHQEKSKQQSAESKDVNFTNRRSIGLLRRRAKKLAALVMDYDQTIITRHEYEYWPQDPSDLRRERKLKDPVIHCRDEDKNCRGVAFYCSDGEVIHKWTSLLSQASYGNVDKKYPTST